MIDYIQNYTLTRFLCALSLAPVVNGWLANRAYKLS